jgi:OOP family OmpA-OmpF porin
MNSKMRLAIAAIVASGIPLAANAGGFYVGAGIGEATYESADFADCFGDCDTFSDTDFAYNVFVGYSVTDAVAVEIGYQDWGDGNDDAFGATDVSIEPSMLTVMAVGTAPLTDSFSVFGKAGVAFMSIDGAEGSGTFRVSGSSDSQDLALGGGVQWNLDNFGIRLETLWVDAEDADKAMMFGLAGLYKFSL